MQCELCSGVLVVSKTPSGEPFAYCKEGLCARYNRVVKIACWAVFQLDINEQPHEVSKTRTPNEDEARAVAGHMDREARRAGLSYRYVARAVRS